MVVLRRSLPGLTMTHLITPAERLTFPAPHLWIPKVRMGRRGRPCWCVTSGGDCDWCVGDMPSEVSVRFAGVIENDPESPCSDGECAARYNNRFILSRIAPLTSTNCAYQYTSPDWTCSACAEDEHTFFVIDAWFNFNQLLVRVTECPCTPIDPATDVCGGGLGPHFFRNVTSSTLSCQFEGELELTGGNGFRWNLCDGRIASGAQCWMSVG